MSLNQYIAARSLSFFSSCFINKSKIVSNRLMNVLFLTDVEIAKLEKRKARYLERSPSPPNVVPAVSASDLKPPSPELPIPSVAPHKNNLAESNAKLMYMSAIGLCRVPDSDKDDNEIAWNAILDDRIARRSESVTTIYMKRLRDKFNFGVKRKTDEETFLSPATNLCGSHSSSSPMSNVTIDFSSLVPLPRHEAQNSTSPGPDLPPLSVMQPKKPGSKGTNSSSGGVKEAKKKRIPIIPWPGVEAIIESYKNFVKGNKNCTSFRGKLTDLQTQ